jgi:hypothetical protein
VKRLKDLEAENTRLRRAISDLTLDKPILQEAARGKLLSPARRRACIEHIREVLSGSKRRGLCCAWAATARRSASSRGAVTMKNG